MRRAVGALVAIVATLLVTTPSDAASVYLTTYEGGASYLVAKPQAFGIVREVHMGVSWGVTHATWRGWGTRRATAVVTGDIIANGSQAPYPQFRTTVTLTLPRRYATCGVLVYRMMQTGPLVDARTGKAILEGERQRVDLSTSDPPLCP